MPNILIVDDDRETCQFIAELVAGPGRVVFYESNPETAISRASVEGFDVVISDINLNTAQSGLDVLRAAKAANPRCQVVLISGFGTLETAIEAVRAGAFDYISKPFNIAQVKAVTERALSQSAMTEERPVDVRQARMGLLGRSAPMLDVYKQIAHAANATAPVLIIGESGTGKELVAKAIHGHSSRSARPFVAVNCGAIAETLLESELFGHMRGSFTGAVADTKGLLEQGHGGSVLLDEIGETSAAMQVKLLRALEEGEVRPVGAGRVVRIDVRVIAATNVEMEQAVTDGRFRKDLYYRLSVILIRIPPLRDRRSDIPLLVDEFLRASCARAGRVRRLATDALEILLSYQWPGNVRELENTIERLVLFSPGTVIEAGDLPAGMGGASPAVADRYFADLPTLDEVDRRYLVHVLENVNGNRTRAAEVMGIDRRTLYRMAERFGIDLRDDSGRSQG